MSEKPHKDISGEACPEHEDDYHFDVRTPFFHDSSEAFHFSSMKVAKNHVEEFPFAALAIDLFNIEGVRHVLFMDYQFTVTKAHLFTWDEIIQKAEAAYERYRQVREVAILEERFFKK